MTRYNDGPAPNRSYFMLEPGSVATVTRPSLPHKVLVTQDVYNAGFAKPLDHVEEGGHLVSLNSKTGATLYRAKVDPAVKSVQLNPGDYLNLCGSLENSVNRKAKLNVLSSPPVQASRVTVALVRAGDLKTTDFTKHLKCYFKSPKILFPGHIFTISLPENIPPNVDLEAWLAHTSTRNFVQLTHSVHFKVISVFSGDTPITGFFYMSSEKTTLYEVSHIHCNTPAYVPSEKVDMFYASEVEGLVRLQQKGRHVPLILVGEKGEKVYI